MKNLVALLLVGCLAFGGVAFASNITSLPEVTDMADGDIIVKYDSNGQTYSQVGWDIIVDNIIYEIYRAFGGASDSTSGINWDALQNIDLSIYNGS